MIRFATKDDIEKLMKFINDNWKANHILARDRDFFEYEHCEGENVNFVISLDDNGNINGMQGFIPYGKHHRDITKNLWKALKSNTPRLGFKILRFLIDNSDARTVASIGSNPKTLNVYRHMGFHVGELVQWYRLNPDADFKISEINDFNIPTYKAKQKKLIEIESVQKFIDLFDYSWYQQSGIIPFKESWYIKKRYFMHPIYKYRLFAVHDDKESVARLVLVFRVDEFDNSRALRLIDCIGNYNELSYVTYGIDKLLQEIKAEYVDLYETGINPNVLINAGWLKVSDSGNIIPNYFNPFEKRNIHIHYASSSSEAVYFKGDGDQDRPS